MKILDNMPEESVEGVLEGFIGMAPELLIATAQRTAFTVRFINDTEEPSLTTATKLLTVANAMHDLELGTRSGDDVLDHLRDCLLVTIAKNNLFDIEERYWRQFNALIIASTTTGRLKQTMIAAMREGANEALVSIFYEGQDLIRRAIPEELQRTKSGDHPLERLEPEASEEMLREYLEACVSIPKYRDCIDEYRQFWLDFVAKANIEAMTELDKRIWFLEIPLRSDIAAEVSVDAFKAMFYIIAKDNLLKLEDKRFYTMCTIMCTSPSHQFQYLMMCKAEKVLTENR